MAERDYEPRPAQPLDYASRQPGDGRRRVEYMQAVYRRLGFVSGMTLACYGLGACLSRPAEAPLMGMGGFLLGLTIPLRRPD